MTRTGQALLCLEPRINGPRRSGGFFYNDCLAAAAQALERREGSSRAKPSALPRFSIQAWDDGHLPPAFVLLDSLWWYVHKRPLDVLSAALAGRSWGIIMHGLPEEEAVLLSDVAEANYVVVPSFWAAGRLQALRPQRAAGGRLDLRVLYPGWDGRPGLLTGRARGLATGGASGKAAELVLASSSNWTRAKGLIEAATALGSISRQPSCPPWIWKAAGSPDADLIAEARRGLGPFADRLEPLGHLDPEALLQLLHGADIILHPSRQETFCLSVFEAALAGRRVVARAIGGVPEAVQLAGLLRCQLGLPPATAHLVTEDVHGAGEPDPLGQAIEEALRAASADANGLEPLQPTALSAIQSGFLREFSWQGRLEKLLLGLSDGPLPATIKPERVEAS
jgi:glycosyltransferase involved in cell wall biosynthesis